MLDPAVIGLSKKQLPGDESLNLAPRDNGQATVNNGLKRALERSPANYIDKARGLKLHPTSFGNVHLSLLVLRHLELARSIPGTY